MVAMSNTKISNLQKTTKSFFVDNIYTTFSISISVANLCVSSMCTASCLCLCFTFKSCCPNLSCISLGAVYLPTIAFAMVNFELIVGKRNKLYERCRFGARARYKQLLDEIKHSCSREQALSVSQQNVRQDMVR